MAQPPAQLPAAKLGSPKETFNTFIESMIAVRSGDTEMLSVAMQCLYLEDIPEAERTVAGTEFANRLYDVIEKGGLSSVDLQFEEGEKTAELVVDATNPDAVITIHQYDDERWRFSYTKTLTNLTKLSQAISAEAPAEQPAPAASDGAGQPQLKPSLKSPRDAMGTFLFGMNAGESGRERAISALDLSGMAADVRNVRGWELAIKLKRVLDRDKKVTLSEIPNYTAGEPFVYLLSRGGTLVIDKVVDSEANEAAWKFSSETVGRIDALYDVYKDLPLADGIMTDTTPTLYSIWLRDFVDSEFPFLLRSTLYIENWQWIGLFVIVCVGMILSRIACLILALIARRIFRRQEMELDKSTEVDFVRPIRIALMAWVWLLGLSVLGLRTDVLEIFSTGAKVVTAAAVVWSIFELIDIIRIYLEKRTARKAAQLDELLVPFVTRTLKVAVTLVGLLIIADTLTFDIKGLLAGLGIGGLAFALAAKETVGNFFGSLTLLVDRPFQIGDWVQIGDIDGTVENVGMRSTRVRTFYNSLITVPNAMLTTATIDNFGARRYRRITTTIDIVYETSPETIEAFCEGIRQLIRKHPYTRKDYYHVYFNDFGPHSLKILLYFFVETPEWGTELRERERLLLDIMRLAQKLGVEFAFPTQKIYFEAQPENGKAASGVKSNPVSAGRRTADKIVVQTLGTENRKPPPVTFVMPEERANSLSLPDELLDEAEKSAD